MKANLKPPVRLELDELRRRLQEAEETLDAIRRAKSMRWWWPDLRAKKSSPCKVRSILIACW